MSTHPINTVAIVGGTHGNELAGIYLLDHWQQHSDLITRNSFTTKTLLANTQAIQQNKRYTDCDLNRQFASADLADMSLTNYEQSRAKVINQQLGPKGKAKTDLVIDLHNTTSNMGATLLLPQKGEFYDLMALYVQANMPEVVVCFDEEEKANDEHHLLCTIGKLGVIVEVGPVSQGVLKHHVTAQMAQMTQCILDFVEAYNANALPSLPDSIEAYRYLTCLTLPQDEQGKRIGMVHQDIEGNDFAPLHPGAPLFALFDGSLIHYRGEQTVYPSFINEAAYYDNNLAMSLCEKVIIRNPQST